MFRLLLCRCLCLVGACSVSGEPKYKGRLILFHGPLYGTPWAYWKRICFIRYCRPPVSHSRTRNPKYTPLSPLSCSAHHTDIAIITPAIHYTMGGVRINSEGRALGESLTSPNGERPIPGLFAAGEVTGGVHGVNRLAGNSLLECVVLGRLAGQNAAADAVAQGLSAQCENSSAGREL